MRRRRSRFVDCENWRKEIKLDEVLPNWDYPEKEDMFKYYPQYYHKTDKVYLLCPPSPHLLLNLGLIDVGKRTADQSTSNSSAAST